MLKTRMPAGLEYHAPAGKLRTMALQKNRPTTQLEAAAKRQLRVQFANFRAQHRLLWSKFSFVAGILIICISGLYFEISHLATAPRVQQDNSSGIVRQGLRRDVAGLSNEIKELEDTQTSYGTRVVDASSLQQELIKIQFELQAGELKSTRTDINSLQAEINTLRAELARLSKERLANPPAVEPLYGFSLTAPILIYHYTPANFEAQLQDLIQKGYTTIDLDMLAQAMYSHDVALPAKPVVITFDDGFGNQMEAFRLLKKYNMKATYYIIVGGAASNYCIGAGRNYSQAIGCGDAYLTWDQVRELDKSGLITIAAHTIDHLNLPAQPPAMQRFQVFEGKAQLEAQLGHPVRHFAYPYGSYNAATEALVREAGFATAVSTLPGTIHTAATIFSLHRVRDVFKLP